MGVTKYLFCSSNVTKLKKSVLTTMRYEIIDENVIKSSQIEEKGG